MNDSYKHFFFTHKNMAKPFQGIAFVSFLEGSLLGVYKQANALIFKLRKAVEMRDEFI